MSQFLITDIILCLRLYELILASALPGSSFQGAGIRMFVKNNVLSNHLETKIIDKICAMLYNFCELNNKFT